MASVPDDDQTHPTPPSILEGPGLIAHVEDRSRISAEHDHHGVRVVQPVCGVARRPRAASVHHRSRGPSGWGLTTPQLSIKVATARSAPASRPPRAPIITSRPPGRAWRCGSSPMCPAGAPRGRDEAGPSTGDGAAGTGRPDLLRSSPPPTTTTRRSSGHVAPTRQASVVTPGAPLHETNVVTVTTIRVPHRTAPRRDVGGDTGGVGEKHQAHLGGRRGRGHRGSHRGGHLDRHQLRGARSRRRGGNRASEYGGPSHEYTTGSNGSGARSRGVRHSAHGEGRAGARRLDDHDFIPRLHAVGREADRPSGTVRPRHCHRRGAART